MRKDQVFVVSARKTDAAGAPLGPVFNSVVCASSDQALVDLFTAFAPQACILGTTPLSALEESARRARDVLAGKDNTWALLVEPGLQ